MSDKKIFSLKVPSQSRNERLDKFLSSSLKEISRTRIKNLIQQGHVTLDGQVITLPKKKLIPGQQITLEVPEPKPLELSPQDLDLEVIYDDEHLIVINKPPGLVVHPGAGSHEKTLVHGLLALCQDLSGIGGVERPGIVHRLDKDTSGIMIVAKHDTCHQALVSMFKDRKLKKTYLAVVHRGFSDKAGIIDLPIGRHPYKRTHMSVNFKTGKEAKTSYKVIENLISAQLLQIRLHTGRTHQIRVHMSHAGCPILGDRTYGGPVSLKSTKGELIEIKRQMLHSWRLEFKHPLTKKDLSLTAELPKDFKDVLNALKQPKDHDK